MTNDLLIAMIVDLDSKIRACRKARWRYEKELLSNMEQDGAEEYVADGATARITRSTGYDKGRLLPILEYVPQGELEKAGAYIPEHDETRTVPANFDVRRLKPFARRGRAVKDVIGQAKILGPPRLQVKETT